MTLKDIFDYAKALPLLLDLLPDAENGGKICPHHDCNGGNGNSKTGATKYTLGGRELLGCFKCKTAGRNGNFSNVDIAAYHLGIPVTGATYTGADALKIAKFLADTFGWQLDGYSSPMKNEQARSVNSPSCAADSEFRKAEISKIVAADVARYRKSPVPVPTKFARAIKRATFERFGVTYDEKWYSPENRLDNHCYTPQKRIIFLCGNSYVARLADKIEDYPEIAQKYIRKAYNGGAVEIFNVAAIDEARAGSVIYAVEGIFDALSLLQIGAENVIAINGAPHWRKLVDRIKARADGGKTLHVTVMFDDDEAGRAAAENTRQALIAAGIPSIARFLPRATGDTSDEKNDANYILQKFGDGALCGAFFQALSDSADEFTTLTEEIKNRAVPSDTVHTAEHRADTALGGITSFADYVGSGRFDSAVEHDRQFADRKTGFANIDGVTKFLPTLGFIGGTPGIGKSDFVIQLLDQVCSAGLYGLYLPLELPIKAVAARIFARRLYRLDRLSTLSATDIRTGAYTAKIDVVRAEVLDSLKFLHIDEEIPTTCQLLIEKLQRYCASVPTPPVIVLDYLQILDFTGEKERRVAIDKMARALKKLQMDTDATIIVVSAVNRAAYHLDPDSSALKESGGLEFNADWVWLLQYATVLAEGGASRADIRKAGRKDPREVMLTCTKNREQPMFECYFNYHAGHSYFEPCDEFDFLSGEDIAEPPEPSQTAGAKRNRAKPMF